MNNSSSVQSITPGVLARRLWRVLCSVRFALILILLITVACLAGALIIQAPDEVLRTPLNYDRWLAGLRPRFGVFTGPMDYLGLFGVFRTWWFNTMVALLVISLTACTINRFPAMWRLVRHQRVKVGRTFFEEGRYRARFPSPGISHQEAVNVAASALRQRRYQVVTINEEDSSHIYARRNQYSRLGTFISHTGIIMVIAAALWGNVAGFSSNLVIPDGSVRAVGHGTGLSVLNEGFTEEDYPDGRPKDYRSDLVIYENGKEVKRQTIRVNEPVEYKGVRFHQAFFGNAAVIMVRDSDSDKILFEDGVALAYRDEYYGKARPVGFFTLFDGRLLVDVVGTAQDAIDDYIKPWEVVIVVSQSDNNTRLFSQKLSQREPFEVAGIEFTFLREKQFTGINVVKNPAVNFIWLASTLMVLGIYAVLYFPSRRIWILCEQSSQPPTLFLAGAAPRLSGFDTEFQGLASALEQELSRSTGSEESGSGGHKDGEERRL